MNPNEIQFEKYWRNQIAFEVEQIIESNPEINATGILLIMKENINDL